MRRAALVALAAAALALVAAATAVAQRRQRGVARSSLASIESAGPRGLGAARAFLEETGRTAARRGPGEPATGGRPVIVLAAPRAPLAAADVEDLLARAREGATVVWALGPGAQPALAAALDVRSRPAPTGRTAAALAPHPLFRGLVLPAGPAALSSSAPGALPVAGGPDGAAALAIPAGAGEVIVLAGPDPLENARAGEGDTAALLARLAARGPVVFDERFLAPAAAAPPRAPAGLGLALAQALAAALLLVLAGGRRLGAVRPPPPGGRATARDHLASLAALYRRAGAEDALAAGAWRALRRRVERAGVPARLADEDAARRLARRSPEAARALREGAAALARGGAGVLLAVSRAAAEVDAALGRR